MNRKAFVVITVLTIIFTILDQTINGALQGFGKVMVPATALACRSCNKAYFKFNFNTYSMDWS